MARNRDPATCPALVSIPPSAVPPAFSVWPTWTARRVSDLSFYSYLSLYISFCLSRLMFCPSQNYQILLYGTKMLIALHHSPLRPHVRHKFQGNLRLGQAPVLSALLGKSHNLFVICSSPLLSGPLADPGSNHLGRPGPCVRDPPWNFIDVFHNDCLAISTELYYDNSPSRRSLGEQHLMSGSQKTGGNGSAYRRLRPYSRAGPVLPMFLLGSFFIVLFCQFVQFC